MSLRAHDILRAPTKKPAAINIDQFKQNTPRSAAEVREKRIKEEL